MKIVLFVLGVLVGTCCQLLSAKEPPVPIWNQFVGRIYASPAIGADGTIYVAGFGHFAALDPDGTFQWSYRFGNTTTRSAPMIGYNGMIYFAGYSGKLYAFNPEGSKSWEFDTGALIDDSPALGSDGTIYFGNENGQLFALYPDGILKWRVTTAGAISSSVAIGTNGTLYVGSGTNMIAVNAQGSNLWTFPTLAKIASSPALASDGTVLIGSTDGNLYALNSQGSKKWAFSTGGAIYSSAVIDANGIIYIGTDGAVKTNGPGSFGKIFAINPDGSKKWEFGVQDAVRAAPALAEDGTIYFGANDGHFYAVNPDGTEKWEFQADGQIEGAATIGSDGRIYVGSINNTIFAFEGSSPAAKSSWPLFRRDVRNRARIDAGVLPIVKLATPGDNAAFFTGAGIQISATITEADEPVDRVEFFAGETRIGTVDRSPYTMVWTNAVAGSYLLTARAIDQLARVTVSAPIHVRSEPAPVVTLKNPSEGAMFLSGDSVSLALDTSKSPAPIVRVDFYEGSRLIAANITNPFSALWTNVLAGHYILSAQATDSLGNSSVTPPVNILVNPRPAILLSAPNDGSYFRTGESFRITADVFGTAQPVARVEFFSGAQLIRSVTNAPYQFDWTVQNAGAYALSARVIDSSGQMTLSKMVTIWAFAPGLQTVAFGSFSTNTGLILQGDASVSGNHLHLNSSISNEVGAAWIGTKRYVAGGFESVFQFQITNQIVGGGAGFAFVIQNNPSPILGNGGPGIGYDGIPKSVAIEFDTFQDVFNQDPAFDHVSTHSRGLLPNSADEAFSFQAFAPITLENNNSLADGKPHRVYVRYVDHTLSLRIEPYTDWSGALAVDLDSYLALQDGEAWIGFTASTAPGAETHDILDWTFSSPNVAPEIQTQPQSQTAVSGTSISFAVQATGAAPLKYQWRLNGTNLPSGTNSMLVLDNVQMGKSGDYTVLVNNSRGSVLSQAAHLSVILFGTRHWEFKANQPILSSPAIDSDGTIYFGANGNSESPDKLFAVTPDGTKKWELPLPSNLRSTPAIADDHTIYIGCEDHNLYAINPNGTVSWSFQAGNSIRNSAAIGSDGTIYFGAGDGRLYAIFPDGKKRWDFATGGYVLSSPAIGSDGVIYFGSLDKKLYAVRPDGTKKWEFATGNEIHSSPAIDADGTIYVSSYDDKLYAIRSDGTLKWAAINGGGDSSPCIGADGTIYIGRGWNLSAFSSAGVRKWTFATTNPVLAGPAVARDGTIYFGSLDGNLYAVNAAGAKLWSASAGSGIGESAPAIGSDGIVYVGTYEGSLLAFNGAAPLGNTAWPMFRQNLARTGRTPSLNPPSITLQPQSGTFAAGTNIVLTVRAIGATPFAYQWLRDGVVLNDGGNAQGTKTPNLSITAAQPDQSGTYTVQITNSKGSLVSNSAIIQVLSGFRPPGTKVWEFQAPDEIITPPAVGWNGTIYFGAVDNKLYALTPAGARLWAYDAGSRPATPSVATDGTLYFGSGWPSNQFLAISPDGIKKWSLTLANGTDSSPAIGFDGKIYFTAKDGKLHALDSDGTPLWETTISDGAYQSSPAIGADGTIYVGAGRFDTALGYEAGEFFSFYPDGTLKWHFSARGPFQSSPAISENGNVYFGSGDNEGLFYAFDRFGHSLWQFRSGAAIFSAPILAPDNSTYFAFNDRTAFALNSNGTKRWSTGGMRTGALAATGTTYFPLNDGHLRALTGAGTEEWSFLVGDWGTPTPPTLGADGTIYIGRGDKLVAIQGSGTVATNAWPMLQCDARHSGNLQTKPVPIAIITQPTEGIHVRPGQNIELAARAFGGSQGISSMKYFADGHLLGSVTTNPYALTWSNAPVGLHHLIALISDGDGVTNTSGEISFIINDPPTIQLSSPSANSVFLARDDVTLAANVSDSDGNVVRVDFFEGEHLLATVTNAPFSYWWEHVAPGSYQLSARATDNFGDTNVSQPVQILVDAFPGIEVTAPSDGAHFNPGDAIALSATASDADGAITRVEFYDGTQFLGSVTTPPFTLTLTNASLGEHVFHARATDDHGARTSSRAVTVTVASANTAPSVTFLAPLNHGIIRAPGNIPIQVRASDSDGRINTVEISAGGSLLPSSSQNGVTLATWTNVPPGEYTLAARAVDNLGSETIRTRQITVLATNQSLPESFLPASQSRTNVWVPDGPIHTMVEHNGTLYIGGAFSHIGQYLPGHAVVELSSESPDLSYPLVDGIVNTLIDDGAGGYYIGGLFNSIGNVNRRQLAHVKADKSVDLNFSADANGYVLTLFLVGETLYAGGEFLEIDGQKQPFIAALDAKTGALKPWNPEPTGWVSALTVTNNTVFLGGNFRYVGGKYRDYIAAIDATTGLALDWNPGADNYISQFLIAGERLYVAGQFQHLEGQLRNGLAAFDFPSEALADFNTGAMGGTRSMISDGDALYIAGSFGVIGVNLTSGSSVLPALTVSGSVDSVAASGDYLYLAGDFTQVNGVARNRVAAVNRFTGAVAALDINPSGRFVVLGKSGNKVLGAGGLGLIQINRQGLAAIDLGTGFATSWDAPCDGEVFALAATNDTLYVGGTFYSLGGQSRQSLGAVRMSTGEVTSWRPQAAPVRALALADDSLFVGGYFTMINDQARPYVAELDLRTGDPTGWGPIPDGGVSTLRVAGDTIYLGGDFTQMGGKQRTHLASVNRYSGKTSAWNPNPNGVVRSMAISEDVVYVGGGFKQIGGAPRFFLAALDRETGEATAWTANTDSGVLALEKAGDILYVGGQFTTIGGSPRINAAALSTRLLAPNALDWDPRPGSDDSSASVESLAVADSGIYLGGTFKTVAGMPIRYLAAFDFPTHLASPLQLPNGLFRLNFFGPLGYYYVFESSSDLTNWTGIFTNKPPFVFEDVKSFETPARFYRAHPLH